MAPDAQGRNLKSKPSFLGALGCYIYLLYSTERYLITRLLPAYVDVFSGTMTHPKV